MPDNSAGNKRIAKNTILLSIRMLFVLAISLYTSRVVLQVLGVEDFGIYNVVGGFVTMFGFLNNAMSTGIQRFYNFEYGKNGIEGANKVYITSILTQAILAVVTIALIESIGIWYMHEKMVIPEARFQTALFIFQISVASMVLGIMSAPYNAAILAHEKMDYYALLGILDQLLKLGLVLLLPFIPGDALYIYGWLMFIISLINFILNIVYAKIKFVEIKFKRVFYKDLFKSLLEFSGWNIFGKFANIMSSQGLNMVLNLFFGPVVNAARGIAYQVEGAVKGFVSNINIAVKPQLTQAYAQGNIDRTFSLMFSVSKINFFILYLLSLPICLEINFILHIWLGENVPEWTNIFLVLLAIVSIIGTLQPPVSFVVHATGQMKKYQLATSLVDLCIIPISYFTLKQNAYPPTVFIVMIGIYVIEQIVCLLVLKSIQPYSLKKYGKQVIIPLFLSSVLAFIAPAGLRMLMEEGWWRLILVGLTCLISSIGVFYGLGLNKQEKTLVLSFVNKLLKKRNG